MLLNLIAAVAFSLPAGAVMAATQDAMAHVHHASAEQGPSANPSLEKVNADMHAAMAGVKLTGNPDLDFIASMIPHHEGAVAMAKVVLAEGKDPEVKKLAEAIIKAQKQEITWMHKKLRSLDVPAKVMSPANHH